MTLKIIDSEYDCVVMLYDNYKGIVPSIGDSINLINVMYECKLEEGDTPFTNRRPLYIKDRQLHFNQEGLYSVSIWIV